MAHPVSTTEARETLTATVRRFREKGATAEPVVFGSHRKPEAVVMPYEQYTALRDLVEEAGVALMLRDRDRQDSGVRRTLDEVADRFGIDLDEL